MGARRQDRGERRAESLLVVMAAGIVGVTGVIAVLALVGEWWFLAMTMATLLACAGGVVAMILRLLAQAGDPVPVRQAATSSIAARPTEAAPPRSRSVTSTPALG
ncbi:MAG: hypothetical protein AVDCRST_MAG69-780, partial [uncultured Solirubrobacteraceae bacterium]